MHKHNTRSLFGAAQFEKGSCEEMSFYELMTSPNSGGQVKMISEFLHLLSTSSPECDNGHSKAGLHLPGPFLSGFLSAAAWEMLQTQGVENFCPSDIL